MFKPEDFRDSIDDMCDDAVRRLYAFQEGSLVVMQNRDYYKSIIEERNRPLGMVAYNTVARAEIVDNIHPDIIGETVPDYLLMILAGGVINLSQHAAYRGRGRGSIAPTIDTARSHVSEKILMRNHASNEPIKLFSQDLGSLGMTTLVLNHDEDAWFLDYESSFKVHLVGLGD